MFGMLLLNEFKLLRALNSFNLKKDTQRDQQQNNMIEYGELQVNCVYIQRH